MENECFTPEIRLLAVKSSQDLHDIWNKGGLAAPYWRFYWNDAAGAFVHFEGVSHELGPEKLMLIAPDTDFVVSCPGHSRQFYVHFMAGPPYADVRSGVFEFPGDEATLALCRRAMATTERPLKSLRALRAVLTALELLPPERLEEVRMDWRVEAAMTSLRQAGRSNQELARAAGMSQSAFLRLFRQEAGVSPQLYNRTRRVEEACSLLHHSRLDIKAIAERTGFCDRYHFSRVFKRLRGVSPAEFRRQGPNPALVPDYPSELGGKRPKTSN